MKKIILSLLVASPIGLWAQSTFTIAGQLKNSPVSGQYVYLAYAQDGKSQLDSAKVTDGKYAFKGEVTAPEPASLFSVHPQFMRNKNERVTIFLEPVSFTIAHVDSFSNVVITGSVANTEYDKLKKQIEPLMNKMQPLAMDYRKARADGDTVKVAMLEKQLNDLDSVMKQEILMKYVKNNPASPVALFALQNAVGGDLDVNVVGPVFDHLSEANKTSPGGVAFQKALDAARKTSVGQQAPDFTQNDTLGNPVKLSSFRGGYVLVDFWASWCGPCRMENPNVVKAYNRYKGKGFKIISVSLDKSDAKDKWLAAIHKDGLSWTHVSDLQFWDNAVAVSYGVKSIPTNFLLDPQGKIVGKSLRGEELDKKLEDIYKN